MVDSPHLDTLQAALVLDATVPLLVGFSGGLDSMALLHALAGSQAQRMAGLRAIHVHHGLHAEADRWAEHCRQACAALDVPLHVARVEVPRDAGFGLEAAARTARYAAFQAHLQPGESLVTAHHLEDQAETFLLRALRASGPEGLAAMQTWRGLAHGEHWRPLLALPRAALLAHAQRHGLQWIEDTSNLDGRHERNFLRLWVMPLLRQRWAHADAAFARSAALSAQASGLLAGQDARDLAAACTLDPQVLRASALHALAAPRAARVLRAWVAELGLPALPGNGVARIIEDLLPARADARARFVWAGCCVQRWRDLLHAGAVRAPLPDRWEAPWDGRQPLALPAGGSLELHPAAALPGVMVVHARRGGERIRLPGRAHSHSLKHVLQELGVPPWERARLPLLSDAEGELLAVGDMAYSAGLDAWLRERQARLLWQDSDSPGLCA